MWYSVPGKVFVLGEYAVLADRPAIVATLGPRFGGGLRGDSAGAGDIHPRSPAGRLLDWAAARGVRLEGLWFKDPYEGAGGFGASTAQFALVYRLLAERMDLPPTALAARAMYRELARGERVPPSGADLVAQWSGGVVSYDPGRGIVRDCARDWNWGDLLVFSAAGLPGRKVATHDHLERLGAFGTSFKELGSIVEQALESGSGSQRALGEAMDLYAGALHAAGLEAEAAHADRKALRRLPGVIGVKGAGALLSDAVIVMMEPGSSHRADVLQAASSRGLALVANGIEQEAGISCAD